MKNKIFSTYIVSILSAFSVFLSLKVLSNLFEYNVFLEYLKVIRYLNWFYVFLALSFGFGIIYHIKNGEDDKSIFSSALWIILIQFALLLFFTSLVSNEYIIFTLFIFGQIIFHIVVSYYRGIKNITYANYLTVVVKFISICLVLLLVFLFDIKDYRVYLLLVGLISLVVLFKVIFQVFQINKVELKNVKNIFNFSFSRWIENILRISYVVVILFLLDMNSSVKVLAGEFALVFTVLKFIESVTQPVVMTLFSVSGREKEDKNKAKKGILIYSFIFSIIIIGIFYYFSDYILIVLFNEEYTYLSEYLFLIAFAIFPLLSTVLIKGLYEEYFKISPLIILNLLMLFSIVFLFFIELNLYNVSIFVIVSYWIRFILFLLYLRYKNVYN